MSEVVNQCCCSKNTEVQKTVCCSGKKAGQSWITGYINTKSGEIPVIQTVLAASDLLGLVRMRIGVGRSSYRIEPGLYATGKPDENSPVLVTANYKMTFDLLRRELRGRNLWIMVLDTKGINVWCAAGKGTFGTDELLKRINVTELANIVSHRQLVLPQLGAPGVSAHDVKKKSGFKVIYGPVMAKDIPVFLDSGMKVSTEMRRVRFNLIDRLCMTPLEITGSVKITFIALIISLLTGGLSKEGFSFFSALSEGGKEFLFYLSALLCGTVITPLLLPWIPARAFSIKGAITGIIVLSGLIQIFRDTSSPCYGGFYFLPWFLIIPAISSFFAMNFTGSTTYTSLSGVMKEVKIALPVQIFLIAAGLILLIISHFT
ncbi:MAG: mercury methylation corrinoid protein HgcA [Candidatus Eremiobacterota bacterium]